MHHENLKSFVEAFDKIEALRIRVVFTNGDAIESSVLPYTDDIAADLQEDLISFNEGHPFALWNKESGTLSYVYLHNVREIRIIPVAAAS
jgi:hypothetical protein